MSHNNAKIWRAGGETLHESVRAVIISFEGFKKKSLFCCCCFGNFVTDLFCVWQKLALGRSGPEDPSVKSKKGAWHCVPGAVPGVGQYWGCSLFSRSGLTLSAYFSFYTLPSLTFYTVSVLWVFFLLVLAFLHSFLLGFYASLVHRS